jgi:hypothetical protein
LDLPILATIDAADIFEQRIAAIGFLKGHVKYERERFERFLEHELGAD